MPTNDFLSFPRHFLSPNFCFSERKGSFSTATRFINNYAVGWRSASSGKVFLIFSSKLNLCGSFRKVAIFFATCVWRRLTLTASSKRSFTPTVVPLNRRRSRSAQIHWKKGFRRAGLLRRASRLTPLSRNNFAGKSSTKSGHNSQSRMSRRSAR